MGNCQNYISLSLILATQLSFETKLFKHYKLWEKQNLFYNISLSFRRQLNNDEARRKQICLKSKILGKKKLEPPYFRPPYIFSFLVHFK
jgi:hypothetical protein